MNLQITLNWSLNTLQQRFLLVRTFLLAVMHPPTPQLFVGNTYNFPHRALFSSPPSTSWIPRNVTSWGRPHIVLYVMPRNVPYGHVEDVSCRRYEDVPIWSNMQLQGTFPTDILRMFFRDVTRTSWRRPYIIL